MEEFVTKLGWLYKEGSNYKTWKYRHFHLSTTTLLYYSKVNDPAPKGVIFLEGCIIRDADKKRTGKDFSWEVYSAKRSFLIHAEDEKSKVEWMNALNHNIHLFEKMKKKQAELEKINDNELAQLRNDIQGLEKELSDQKFKQKELQVEKAALEAARDEAIKDKDYQIKAKDEIIAELEEKNLVLKNQIEKMKVTTIRTTNGDSSNMNVNMTNNSNNDNSGQSINIGDKSKENNIDLITEYLERIKQLEKELVSTKKDRTLLKKELRRLCPTTTTTNASLLSSIQSSPGPSSIQSSPTGPPISSSPDDSSFELSQLPAQAVSAFSSSDDQR